MFAMRNMRKLRKFADEGQDNCVVLRLPVKALQKGCLTVVIIAAILLYRVFYTPVGGERLSVGEIVALGAVDLLLLVVLLVRYRKVSVSFHGNKLTYRNVFGRENFITLSPETYCDADFDRFGRLVILFANPISGQSVEIPLVFHAEELIRLIREISGKFGGSLSPPLTMWVADVDPNLRVCVNKCADYFRDSFTHKGKILCRSRRRKCLGQIFPILFFMVLLAVLHMIAGGYHCGIDETLPFVLLEVTLSIPVFITFYARKSFVSLHKDVLISDDGRICRTIPINQGTQGILHRGTGLFLQIYNLKPPCVVRIKGRQFAKEEMDGLVQLLNTRFGCHIEKSNCLQGELME